MGFLGSMTQKSATDTQLKLSRLAEGWKSRRHGGESYVQLASIAGIRLCGAVLGVQLAAVAVTEYEENI